MERRLGVSVYPEHSDQEEIKKYLTLAAKYKFKRVFTCLLSAQKDKEIIKEEFKNICHHARQEGLEVTLDVSPRVFEALEISYDDLSFFKEVGADVIRLDMAFDGLKEANMSYNKEDLIIELNLSNENAYLENVISYKPKMKNIYGCHNFYPQKDTGLDYDLFIKASAKYKHFGIKTAAFVTSHNANIGPWQVMDGLCTLEDHRSMPLKTQAKHLWATNVIDDVIIGNYPASEKELKDLSSIDPYILTLDVNFETTATNIEKTITINENHFRRGDITTKMIRSTMSRIKFKAENFEPINNDSPLSKGDIIIANNNFGQYKGEMHVILDHLEKDVRKNKIGKIVNDEIFLLDYISAWSRFVLKENTNE